MDFSKIAEALIDEVLGPLPPDDTVMAPTGLEVLVEDTWIPTTSELWRAWTGRRRVWGMEHHGPVTPIGSPNPDAKWTGRRECKCSTCQSNVAPEFRPN